jgi:hypothetical protein
VFAQFECDLNLNKFFEQAKTFNEPNLEDPLEECFAQYGCDLDLDKFLEQDETSNEPSLEDPTKECFAQFELDLDLDMICEQGKALLDLNPEMRTENGETAEISFPNPSLSGPVLQIYCTRKRTSRVQYNGVEVQGRTYRELYS